MDRITSGRLMVGTCCLHRRFRGSYHTDVFLLIFGLLEMRRSAGVFITAADLQALLLYGASIFGFAEGSLVETNDASHLPRAPQNEKEWVPQETKGLLESQDLFLEEN